MLLTLRGKVTQVYQKDAASQCYITLADADTLTVFQVRSDSIDQAEVSPYVDRLCDIELNVKVTQFRGVDQWQAIRINLKPVPVAAAPAAQATKN